MLSSLPPATWLSRMERLCAALGASMVRRLVTGAPQAPHEEANARWLLHPLLLRAEVGRGHEDSDHDRTTGAAPPRPPSEAGGTPSGVDVPPSGTSEGDGRGGAPAGHLPFMQRLCRLPASRESQALSTAMKRVVLEDRGGDLGTNEVVWAVAVAAVHHAGVAGEAAGVVRSELAGSGPSPADTSKETRGAGTGASPSLSPALVRAWRSAQKARGQLGAVPLSSGSRALILRRAYFLLFLRPWACPSRVGGSSVGGGRRDEAAVALALRTTEMVLECLLGKAATGGQGRGDPAESVEEGGTEATVGAREGEGGIGALLSVIDARSERARSRARGLALAVRFLDGTGSDRAATGILLAMADGLRAGCAGPKPSGSEGAGAHTAAVDAGELGRGRLHFMSGVECCDSASKSALVESTVEFLGRCSVVLGREGAGGGGAAAGRSPSCRRALVNALCAVSMDYEWDDNDVLQRSRLLPVVSSLVDDGDRSVAAAASKAVRKFFRCAVPAGGVSSNLPRERSVPGAGYAVGGGGGAAERFWVGEHDTLLRHERESGCTPFQRTFFAAVRRKLQDAAVAVGEGPPVTVDPGLSTSAATTTAAGALAAARGLALAHACCRVESGRRELSTPESVRALMRLVLLAGAETRGWALRVCAAALPWVEPGLVDGEFRRVVPQDRVARAKEPLLPFHFHAVAYHACLRVLSEVFFRGRDVLTRPWRRW